jgi:hypothetical protein
MKRIQVRRHWARKRYVSFTKVKPIYAAEAQHFMGHKGRKVTTRNNPRKNYHWAKTCIRDSEASLNSIVELNSA